MPYSELMVAPMRQDLEATERAREYFLGYPPSSPSAAILRDGELVFMMERHEIEGQTPQDIAAAFKSAFDKHCRQDSQ